MNVAQLTIEMAANVARLKTDMAAARNTVEGTMNSIKKAAGAAQVALGAIGVGLSAAAFTNWIKGAINAADEANKLSQKIGITVKEIGGLQLAFKQGGVDADTMQKALAKLNVGIASGDSAFKALGVSTKNTDGSLRSTSMVLADVADRFAGTQDGAAKTAMAIDLFGKSGAALIPVLNAGGSSIREFQALAEQLGLTLSSETAAAAEKFNDTLELIGMGSRGIANQVMAELLPTLQSLAGEFLNLMTQGGNLKGIADVISAGLKGMFTVAAVGVEIFRTLGNTIGATAAAIVAFATGDFKGASTIISELGKDVTTNWTNTLASLDRLWNQTGNTAIEAAAKITKGSIGSAAAMEDAAKAAKKLADEQDKARKAADDLVASIAFETETMQMSNLEREIANNLLKLEKTGLQENTEEYRAYAEAIRLATIENEGIKQRIKLEKDAADKRKKIEEDYAREVEQINFQIGQSLTDALINGGTTAKEFLINMFKTLILRPILQPIIQGGTSMVMGALGMGASGSAMATPGSLSNTAGLGQIGSLASTMNTLYTGLAGGFTAVSSAIGGGLASLAAATESASLASFAAGMQGASLAPGLAGPTTAGATGAMGAGATAAAFAQGAAGIGAGVLAGEYISGGKSLVGGNSLWTTGGGAAAGAAIGTAILPGIGTAIGGLIGGIVGGIANAGWGSGAKEMQGSGMASGTITGGGLQEAQFYQNWKKEGGWFKSDQYGRDTQAMSAELVTYINDASKAIQDSGKDYATLLKLSGEGIDAVTLSFDFAVGSMEQLTENLGNTLDDYANKVADAILAGTNFGKSGETSYETIQRLVNSLNLVNPILDTLGLKMFDMSASGGAAASAFIDLMGGMDQFTQSTDFYYQNFYTEAERIAKTTENLQSVFSAMNVELPTSVEAYRALVDATREAGNDQLLANLFKLAPAFMQIANAASTSADTIMRNAESIARERDSLESRLLQAQGNTAAIRERELDALDESNRAIQEQIWAIEDQKSALTAAQTAVDAAMANLEKAVAKERESALKELSDTYNAFVKNIERQKSSLESAKQTAQNSINYFKGIFDMLGSEIDKLRGNVTTPQDVSGALAFISRAAAGGVLPNQEQLGSAISTATGALGSENFASAFEQRRATQRLAGELEQLQEIAGEQWNIAEQQLAMAESQLASLDAQLLQAKEQYDAEVERTNAHFDKIIEDAQAQLDALNGVNDSVLSVEAAIQGLNTAITQLANAQAAAKTPGVVAGGGGFSMDKFDPYTVTATWIDDYFKSISGQNANREELLNIFGVSDINQLASFWGSPSTELYEKTMEVATQAGQRIDDIASIYQDVLGRAPDTEGLNYWRSTGLSVAEVQTAIENSQEAASIRGFASGGYASGLAMVGENGPELVNFQNPAMVYNAAQTQNLMSSGVSEEIRGLREDNKVQARAMVQLQTRMNRLFERWDGDGMPETRVVTA